MQNTYIYFTLFSIMTISHITQQNLVDLVDIANIAQKQRQENIMNVIRHNDFNSGYDASAKFEVLKEKSKEKLGINYETQLDILFASEENPELREK